MPMDDKSTKNILQNEIDALARLLLPKIQEYFDSDVNVNEYLSQVLANI